MHGKAIKNRLLIGYWKLEGTESMCGSKIDTSIVLLMIVSTVRSTQSIFMAYIAFFCLNMLRNCCPFLYELLTSERSEEVPFFIGANGPGKGSPKFAVFNPRVVLFLRVGRWHWGKTGLIPNPTDWHCRFLDRAICWGTLFSDRNAKMGPAWARVHLKS